MKRKSTNRSKAYSIYKQLGCHQNLIKGVFLGALMVTIFLVFISVNTANAQSVRHRVQKKETLYGIARKYNIAVGDIMMANNLPSATGIDTGMVLLIPVQVKSPVINTSKPSVRTHTVAKKETLFKIATMYGVSVDDMKRVNNLASNDLEVGTVLNIPGTSGYTLPTPTVTEQTNNTSENKTSVVPDGVNKSATDVAEKIVGIGEPDNKGGRGEMLVEEGGDNKDGRTHEVKTRYPKKLKKGQYKTLGDYFKYSSLPILILRIGAILFILAIIVIAVVILMMRTNKTIDENKQKQFDKFFQELVTQIIFTEKENETDEFEEDFTHEQAQLIEEFEKEFLSIPFFRQVCIDRLMEVYKSLSGLAAKRVENLYYEFDLVNDTLRKIKSARWEEKVRGIREVEQMHLRQAYKQVYGLINHPNEMLRYEAQLAVVSLRRARHLSFLEKLDTPLSSWQHMNLVSKLKKIPNYDVRNMDKLLGSPNPSVNVFAIKMIQDFNMVKKVPDVQRMLDHPNEDVKIAAIKTLSYMHNDKSIPKLLSAYPNENERVQSEILKYVGNTGSTEHAGMLRQLMESTSSNISHAAQEALALMSYQPLDELNLLLETKGATDTKALPEGENN